MAQNLTPSASIVGITVVEGAATAPNPVPESGKYLVTNGAIGKYVIIPITSIPQLNPDGSEVTDAAGNINRVAFALAEKLYQLWAAMPAADRPVKWSSYRSAGTPTDAGIREPTYTNRFTVVDSATEVQAE